MNLVGYEVGETLGFRREEEWLDVLIFKGMSIEGPDASTVVSFYAADILVVL